MQGRRLITIFDEQPDILLMDSDVILTNSASYLDSDHKIFFVSGFDASDRDEELINCIRQEFCLFPKDWQVLHNSLYHKLLRPIVHVLRKIDQVIIQEQIEEICLFGGSDVPFLTISNAEGEGEKKTYHSSWLFNSIIYQYYNADESVRLVWKKKKNRLGHAVLFWCRENYNYYRRAIGYMVRDLRYRTKPISLKDTKKKIVIALADLELQYKHLAKTIMEIDQYEKIYVLGRRIIPMADDKVCQFPALSLLTIFGILKQIRKACVCNKWMTVQVNSRSVKLPINQILKGAKERLFIALYQEIAFSQLVHRIGPERIQCVCTNRTMGADICYVQNVCKKFDLLHINFQYVAMAAILYPDMNVADRFYLYSRNTYEFYKNYGKQFFYYLPLNRHYNKMRSPKVPRVVIFTQPDMYTDRYLTAIRSILECFQKNNSQVEIIIKLHYRQDKVSDFVNCEQYYSHTKVLREGNAGEVMSTCDCVISMTSSVLFEALLNGIPALILDFDGRDKALIEGSDVCVSEVNYIVHSPQEIFGLICNYSSFWMEYMKRLEAYLKKNKVISLEVNKLVKL